VKDLAINARKQLLWTTDMHVCLAMAFSGDIAGADGIRGVRIFDSANSNFEKVEKFDSNSNSANSNSNWQIGIRFARIVVVQNSFMNNSKARSNIRE
jgi:hypothetical protein